MEVGEGSRIRSHRLGNSNNNNSNNGAERYVAISRAGTAGSVRSVGFLMTSAATTSAMDGTCVNIWTTGDSRHSVVEVDGVEVAHIHTDTVIAQMMRTWTTSQTPWVHRMEACASAVRLARKLCEDLLRQVLQASAPAVGAWASPSQLLNSIKMHR